MSARVHLQTHHEGNPVFLLVNVYMAEATDRAAQAEAVLNVCKCADSVGLTESLLSLMLLLLCFRVLLAFALQLREAGSDAEGPSAMRQPILQLPLTILPAVCWAASRADTAAPKGGCLKRERQGSKGESDGGEVTHRLPAVLQTGARVHDAAPFLTCRHSRLQNMHRLPRLRAVRRMSRLPWRRRVSGSWGCGIGPEGWSGPGAARRGAVNGRVWGLGF